MRSTLESKIEQGANNCNRGVINDRLIGSFILPIDY